MNDKINNFILLNKRNNINKCTIIINKDKASNYKVYNSNKELSKINIENEKLNDIIHHSYHNYERN